MAILKRVLILPGVTIRPTEAVLSSSGHYCGITWLSFYPYQAEINALRRVLITGARGFIGRQLSRVLLDDGWWVRGAVRSPLQASRDPAELEYVAVGDIASEPDWHPLLEDAEAVVHLAAISDFHGRAGGDAERALFRVNVDATQRLAFQAARAGVRRLVFLSTIKVLGESSDGQAFTERSLPAPQTLYARSKYEAERRLLTLASEQQLEIVIIRPCMVFGPGARGSLLQLMKLVATGLPLPLAGLANRRSLVSVANLCDLIRCALDHPRAAENVLLATDDPPLSTTELVRQLAGLMGRPDRLFSVPNGMILLAGILSGKRVQINSLIGSLEVDASETRERLHWEAPLQFESAMAETVADFLAQTDLRGWP